MGKTRKDDNMPYLLIAGIVAMVGIVALVLHGGVSLQGAATTSDLCTDNDVGDDIYKPGVVTIGNQVYEDYCVDDKDLIQQYCHTGRDVSSRRIFTCPNGCLNGACLRS